MRTSLFASVALVALVVPGAAMAQETTSTIRGTVTSQGAPVANATVTVTHVPSGTRSSTTSRNDGSFSVSGLRFGGPFTVDIAASGYADSSITDIFTVIAQPFELPVELAAAGDEIVVTASSIRGARAVSMGPATVLGADDISKVATLNRDIRDLARRDPFASLDTSFNRAVTFAGQNPRFNRFTVDGVPIGDSFGLNPDGLPSRRGPVPLDAIGQFETKVAPFDVREGFFQGGVVNAVLRSGTNKFQGTAFYTYNDDSMVGQNTRPILNNPTGVVIPPKFKSKDFGAELSGPIIPDKLFFMVAAERVRAAQPLVYGTVEDNAGTPVVNLTNAMVQRIQAAAKARYGYDAGGIIRNNGDKDDRVVARLDANIDDNNRVSLTGIYTKDEIITATQSNNGTLSLESNAYVKPNEVKAGILQWNSTWSDSFSTEIRGLYKQYDSGQIPIFPRAASVSICTANVSANPGEVATGSSTFSTNCPTNVARVELGTGGPSQANELHIKTYGGSFLGRLNAGNHVFRLLVDYTYTKSFNVFVNGSRGSYYFDSITDFENGNAGSFSYTNAPDLNPNTAAAVFNYSTYTFGLQDNWRVNDMLNVSLGVRYDLYGGTTRPTVNPSFVNRYGFSNASYISGRGLFQPRLGFDFQPIQRLSVHGGTGIFGGGSPDVYIGNSFSNTGVLSTTLTGRRNDLGVYQINGTTNGAAAGLINGITDITKVPAAADALLAAQGANAGTIVNPAYTTTVNALDPNFKLPSQWRSTLSANYTADLGPLGDGWHFGVDAFYSKVINQVSVIDIRSVPVAGSFTPDGRQRYTNINGNQNDTGADLLLTNSKLGRTWVGVVHFDKAWDFGLSVRGSYSRQDAKDGQAFTSSIANSNYQNSAWYDANRPTLSRSNDEVKWSFKYGVGFDRAFFGDYRTRIDLFGESRAGAPYSYTFQDVSSQRSSVFGTAASASRYLFYVPTVNDPLVTYANAATQTAVENLINSTDLKNYRGQVAPRNAFRSKAYTKIDLHVEQEIPTFVGSSRVTVFADIENFTNLLNKKWGQQLHVNGAAFTKVVSRVGCVAQGANTCAQYVYSQPTSAATLADTLVSTQGSSLYAIRVGARFSF